MIDHRLRHLKGQLLAPLAKPLRHVSPSTVSLLGLVTGLAAAAAAYLGAYWLALALWLVNRVLDGLDGEIARTHGASTDLGGLYDLVADFVVYSALLLAVAAQQDAYAVAAVLLAMFYVNAALWTVLSQLLERRAHATARAARTTAVAMPAGLIEGAETVVLYSLFLLLPGAFESLAWAAVVLMGVTIAQRLSWSQTALRPQPSVLDEVPTRGAQTS